MASNVTAIIIARQGSSRLPGKALMKIMGKSILSLIIEKLRQIKQVNQICVATSELEIDEPIIDLAKKEGVIPFAGHPDDVVDRLYHAAKACNADIIYEVGGDCPLIDYETFVQALNLLSKNNHDFVHNFAPTTYPDGLDLPLLTFDCLKRVHEGAVLNSQRIHPFSYIFANSEKFSIGNFVNTTDHSHIRLTLDYEEDYILIKEIFERLYPSNPNFQLKDVINLFSKQPNLLKINSKYVLPPAPEGYWNTLAYIDDIHNDIEELIKSSKKYNKDKDFLRASKNYKEMINTIKKLDKRAEHFIALNRNE